MLMKKYEITCDQSGCFNRYRGGMLKGAVKAEARGAGWRTTRSFWGVTHTCPGCQERNQTPSPLDFRSPAERVREARQAVHEDLSQDPAALGQRAGWRDEVAGDA